MRNMFNSWPSRPDMIMACFPGHIPLPGMTNLVASSSMGMPEIVTPAQVEIIGRWRTMLSNIASSVAIASARIHFPLVAREIIQRTEGNDSTILQQMLDALLDQRSNENHIVGLYLGTYQNELGERAMAHIAILDEIKTMLEMVQLDNVQTMSQAEADNLSGSVQPITLGNVQVFGQVPHAIFCESCQNTFE